MTPKELNQLGNRIKTIRVALGLTMEEFIERIDGKSGRGRSGTVNNWETGKNSPNKKRLAIISKLGNVSVDYLLHGNGSNLLKEKTLLTEIQRLDSKKAQQDVQAIVDRLTDKGGNSIETELLRSVLDLYKNAQRNNNVSAVFKFQSMVYLLIQLFNSESKDDTLSKTNLLKKQLDELIKSIES